MKTKSKKSTKAVLTSHIIKDDIKSGYYKPGVLFPKENFLTEKYSVSRPTIRKAIDMLIAEGLLEKLPYRGVVLPVQSEVLAGEDDLGHIVFATPALLGETNEYVSGISTVIDRDKLALSTMSSHADISGLKQAYESILRMNLSGVIVHTGLPPERFSLPGEELGEANFPIVAVGQHPVPGLVCDRVVESPSLNMGKVLEYALPKGYRNIAMFAPGPASVSEESVSVLRSTLANHDIELKEDNVIRFLSPRGYENPPDPYIDSEIKMRELLADGFKCDLLICSHDYPAVGALRAIVAAGLSVPEDIAVISLEQNPVRGVFPVPLTTVSLHRDTQGKVAMELLNRRIAGYDGPAETHYVQPDIVIGKTC